jgi:dTDP-4-amino-4,6-dideoxygalactose transaminase
MEISLIDLDHLPKMAESRKNKYAALYQAIKELPAKKAIQIQFKDAEEKKKALASLFSCRKRKNLPISILGGKDGSLNLWIRSNQ